MKNLLFAAASLASLLLMGCNKLNPAVCAEDGATCELNLHLTDNALTKVTGTTGTNEAKIQNVQIFVFRTGKDDANSVLDACTSLGFDGAAVDVSKINLKCTVGSRQIYAIANADADYTADGSVGTVADLLSKTMMLEKMEADRLLMLGNLKVDLVSGTQGHSVTVYRACASVILESVTNEMQASIYRKDGSFKIKNVYLTNVPAKINFGQTIKASSLSESDCWYARMTAETDSGKNKLIYDAQAETIVNPGSANANKTAHTFYTFPNDCDSKTDAAWCPRATRLVIEAMYYDGTAWRDCYYPITLYKSAPGLEANKQYKVNLTVNRPGSDDPDKPIVFGDLSGTITVSDWFTGESYTETI